MDPPVSPSIVGPAPIRTASRAYLVELTAPGDRRARRVAQILEAAPPGLSRRTHERDGERAWVFRVSLDEQTELRDIDDVLEVGLRGASARAAFVGDARATLHAGLTLIHELRLAVGQRELSTPVRLHVEPLRAGTLTRLAGQP